MVVRLPMGPMERFDGIKFNQFGDTFEPVLFWK